MTSPAPDPGSFRDPMSRVFLDGDTVLRTLDPDGLADFEALARHRLLRRGDRLGCRSSAPSGSTTSMPRALGDDWAAVLRHERIPFISYPYEWSFEMLRDAAKLQLDLTAAALAEDLTTKDATSYNVQFVGARPTFIDIGSFERLREAEPWYGYRQFCQLFLFPLMFQAYKDLPFQPWLRVVDRRHHADRGPQRHVRVGTSSAPAQGHDVHVSLHARADRKHADTDRDVKADLEKAGFKKEITINQVEGPAQGGRVPSVEAVRFDVVGLHRPGPLHRRRPDGRRASS